MRQRSLFLICLSALLWPAPAVFSQENLLYGILTDENAEALVGATVKWADLPGGTQSDTLGRFWIVRRSEPAILIVLYPGYEPAQVEVLPHEDSLWIEVRGIRHLREVTVQEHRFDTRTSLLDARNVEHISRNELRKAPCCNLSESFETNGTAEVTYSNALTGVKEIQMLGLRGIYSQFLVENRPTLQGIATPYAFEYLPGSWLDGIQLAKGASTVKNGFAGISGQINAELVKPMRDKPLFVNAFTSTEGRGELNVHLNRNRGRWAQGFLGHANLTSNRWDMNGDNFYDSPNRRQLNGLYRLFYESPQMCAQLNVQALTDYRRGGQIRPIEGVPTFFGVQIQNDRVEVWGKLGLEGLDGRPYRQLGNMVGASWHRTNGTFGPNRYAAEQRSLYWQTLYQSIIGTTDHQIVIAPSLQYDGIQERVNEQDLSRTEWAPGIMAEYTYNRPNLRTGIPDWSVVIGGRIDWNSRFGWFFTPRAGVKYSASPQTAVRVSAGRGYRSPHLMAENISLLAGNRQLSFADNLRHEEAWNYGLNFTHEFNLAGRKANINLDAYRTDFIRQIVVDVDRSPTEVSFYYTPGKAFANNLLVMAQYALWTGLDVRLAYKWTDTRTTFGDGIMRLLPLVAQHRGLLTIDYTTPDKKWMFNTRLQLVGPQRLPDNSQVPHELVHDFPPMTPTYALWSAQITRSWKRIELYVGGENLTGFQQHHAIIAADDPGSPFFNGSQIWAPIMGPIAYAGIRFAPSGL